MPNPGHPAEELRADLNLGGHRKVLAVGAGCQDRRGAEPVDHRPGKAVLALQRDPLERAVEHAEHLLHIRIYVEIGVFPGTLTGSCRAAGERSASCRRGSA